MALQNDWSLEGIARRRDQYFPPGMIAETGQGLRNPVDCDKPCTKNGEPNE